MEYRPGEVRCPFYGFFHTMKTFCKVDSNRCPLRGSHSSCIMEDEGKRPEWYQCPMKESVPDAIERYGAHKTFSNQRGNENIEFKVWAEHVLKGNPLPGKQ